jgi:hypothetical protein
MKIILIVGSTVRRANLKLQEIYDSLNKDEVKSYYKSINGSKITMLDGTQYRVFGFGEYTRGIRWDCAYIYKNLSLNLLDSIIFPMAKYTTEIHWF